MMGLLAGLAGRLMGGGTGTANRPAFGGSRGNPGNLVRGGASGGATTQSQDAAWLASQGGLPSAAGALVGNVKQSGSDKIVAAIQQSTAAIVGAISGKGAGGDKKKSDKEIREEKLGTLGGIVGAYKAVPDSINASGGDSAAAAFGIAKQLGEAMHPLIGQFMSFGEAIVGAGNSLLAFQRTLADASPSQLLLKVQSEQRKFFRDMREGERTAGATSELQDAMESLNDTVSAIRAAIFNNTFAPAVTQALSLMNRAMTIAVERLGVIVDRGFIGPLPAHRGLMALAGMPVPVGGGPIGGGAVAGVPVGIPGAVAGGALAGGLFGLRGGPIPAAFGAVVGGAAGGVAAWMGGDPAPPPLAPAAKGP